MKILIRSLKLYFLGIILDTEKKHFDRLVDKYIERNLPLSCRRLTGLSHRCSRLYDIFIREEQLLMREIALKKAMR